MKKIILFLGLFTLLYSCSKDNSSIVTANMSAKIDQKDWITLTRTTVLNDGKFIITGVAIDGSSLAITIFGDNTGDFKVSPTQDACEAVYKKTATTSTDDSYLAFSGNVSLTEVDNSAKRISGTFSFTLIHSLSDSTLVNITEGKFTNLKFTDTSGL